MSTSLDRITELAQQIRAGCNQLLEGQPVRTDWLGRTSQLVFTLGLSPTLDWIRQRRNPGLLANWEKTSYRKIQMNAIEDGSGREVSVVSYGDVPPTMSKRHEFRT